MDNLFLLLFLISIVAFFVGLIRPELVIRWGDKENKNRKSVLKVYGLAIIAFFVLFSISTPSSNNKEVSEAEKKSESVETKVVEVAKNTEPLKTGEEEETKGTGFLGDYKIVEKEEHHMENAKRYAWHVVIKGEINKKDLQILAKSIIEVAKEGDPFNSISIMLYDYEEYINNIGYSLGKVDYAPGGDWGSADTVNAGEYGKMDYSFNLREKNWEKQLTKNEVAITKSWYDLYDSYYENAIDDNLPDEEEINQEIAKKFNLSEKEVDDLLMKEIMWVHDDN